MSQPEAALYIQPPTFETNVAVQITANAVWRNGAANETVSFEFDLSVLTLLPSGKKELTEQSMRDAPFTGRSRRFESAHSTGRTLSPTFARRGAFSASAVTTNPRKRRRTVQSNPGF
jgi:hypothetical protein